MADNMEDRNTSPNTSETSNFSTVVSLLRQAESLLSRQALPPANQAQSPQATNQSTLISRAGHSQTDRTERSLANFRTLFSRYSSPSSSNRSSSPAPSLGQARSSSGPPSKRKKSNVFVVKDTWAHDFFCLANHRQEQVPSRAEKFQLQDAGLGRKTIVFNRRDQAITFVEKLESIYPKLKDGGGFELLRGGPSNKDLVVITPPASGYSVPFLRESSGLGQAVAYIRPLQKSLSTCTVAAQGLFKVGLF